MAVVDDVRWAGKCFPRWADFDQASSGEPEPPEEVAGGENKLEMGRGRAKRKRYSRAPADSLRSRSRTHEALSLERTGCLQS